RDHAGGPPPRACFAHAHLEVRHLPPHGHGGPRPLHPLAALRRGGAPLGAGDRRAGGAVPPGGDDPIHASLAHAPVGAGGGDTRMNVLGIRPPDDERTPGWARRLAPAVRVDLAWAAAVVAL